MTIQYFSLFLVLAAMGNQFQFSWFARRDQESQPSDGNSEFSWLKLGAMCPGTPIARSFGDKLVPLWDLGTELSFWGPSPKFGDSWHL